MAAELVVAAEPSLIVVLDGGPVPPAAEGHSTAVPTNGDQPLPSAPTALTTHHPDSSDDSGSDGDRAHKGRLAEYVSKMAPNAALTRERRADEAQERWELRAREEAIIVRQAERAAAIKRGAQKRYSQLRREAGRANALVPGAQVASRADTMWRALADGYKPRPGSIWYNSVLPLKM